MAMQHAGHFAQVNGAAGPVDAHVQRQRLLAQLNESTWQRIGSLNELTGDLEAAYFAYEQALRHNQWSIQTLNAISSILRLKEKFPEAMEFLKNILKVEPSNGEAWGNLGHCYLMMDNLQEAYTAYQQALYYLPDPKEPKLWYGIGILYDRYGSLEHAEEAFSQVMRMEPGFEKANEIYFRLGIIYKQQQKFQQSLECFKYIVQDPPRPLNEEDIWFQIGHVHEQQKDYESAKSAYRRVLDRDPKHAKVLQQLGWLHHQQSNSYQSQDQAIEYLEQSVSSDNSDAQSWYLLGRCYMAQQKFPKAYEAYQQAVYRDGRNPTFWCSIGVLYYQINQYRDALDAYSRAIRLNPYISEVWYDLGTLYESCNNQTNDALDAYARAAELDPTNTHIKARLQLLKSGGSNGQANQHSAPVPQDVHPQAYQNGVGVPPGVQWGGQPVQQPPQQPPIDPARVSEWTRGIAGLNPPTGPPISQQSPYESHATLRGPPPRQPSPRQEPPRQYQDPARQTPTVRKMQSPSPKGQQPLTGMYPPANQTLPQINSQERPGLGPAPRPSSSISGTPQQQSTNGTTGAQPSSNLPLYGRPFSPPTELRPIRDDRLPSPSSAYHHPPLPPTPSFPPMGNGSSAPAPQSTNAASTPADHQDRPASAMKRAREWEVDGPSKKVANDETRARLDDHNSRRFSPPSRNQTPRDHYRRSSSEIQRENERRANENYHPSEAAHHPYTMPQQIPSMSTILDTATSSNSHNNNNTNTTSNGGTSNNNNSSSSNNNNGGSSNSNNNNNNNGNSNGGNSANNNKEERKEPVEVAARKVAVDEDYDNNSEDEKKAQTLSGPPGPTSRNSPSGSLGAAPKQESVTA